MSASKRKRSDVREEEAVATSENEASETSNNNQLTIDVNAPLDAIDKDDDCDYDDYSSDDGKAKILKPNAQTNQNELSRMVVDALNNNSAAKVDTNSRGNDLSSENNTLKAIYEKTNKQLHIEVYFRLEELIKRSKNEQDVLFLFNNISLYNSYSFKSI
jgi:hypothetical protein